MAYNRDKYPIITEIKVNANKISKVQIQQKSDKNYDIVVEFGDITKWSDWKSLYDNINTVLTYNGIYTSSGVSAGKPGVLVITAENKEEAHKYLDFIVGENCFDLHLTTRDKNILLEALGHNKEFTPSLLIDYCEKRETTKAEKLLFSGMDDPNYAKNKIGDHPVHIAYKTDNKKLIEVLLSAGANIDKKNDEGKTALVMSVEDGNKSWYKLLKNLGADQKVKFEGDNLLQIATKAFVNIDALQNNIHENSSPFSWFTGMFAPSTKQELQAKMDEYYYIAKDLAHNHPEWINLSNDHTDSPIHMASNSISNDLYKCLDKELHDYLDHGYNY